MIAVSKEKSERSAYSSVSDQYALGFDCHCSIAIRGMASWMARQHVNNSTNN